MQITFTVPNDQATRLLNAVVGLFPNEDPDTYTNLQWAKEVIRRQVVSWVQEYEEREAYRAIDIKKDNSIITA